MQELVCSAFENLFSKVNQISESLLHILHNLDITLFNFNSVFFRFSVVLQLKNQNHIYDYELLPKMVKVTI